MSDRVDLSNTRVRTDDWPAQATDTIVKVVGGASSKVTGPVTTTARGLVFGLFAAILGGTALVLVSVLIARLLNNYLPDSVFGENHMWAAYLILGLLYIGVALVLWAKRKPSLEG